MKFIIFILCFSNIVFADNSTGELTGINGNKFVSQIKDVDIEDKLKNSTEVQKCLKEYKYAPGDATKNSASMQKIEDCFKNALPAKGDQLKELSANLGLQAYNLVQSDNVKEITKYLSDKLYEAMTGVDRRKDVTTLLKSESFKNRKMVDQKDFVDMYKTQITKNVLFEISRFCFENLRVTGQTTNSNISFFDYWKDYFEGTKTIEQVQQYTNDSGIPKFEMDSANLGDKKAIYQEIARKLGKPGAKLDEQKVGKFFEDCSKQIRVICERFQPSNSASPGANACLTQDRLRAMKKALTDTEKIQADYEKLTASNKNTFNAMNIGGNFYNRNDPSKSIDALTNYSSADFLTDQTAYEQQADECAKNPEKSTCEKFLAEGDIDKTKYNIEVESALKKEIELKKLQELKDEKAKLKDYLKEQGYFTLLEKLEQNPNMPIKDLEDAISKMFEAKKKAMLDQLDNGIAKRQIKVDPVSPTPAQTDIATAAPKAVDESKAERARLSQVVLFNNIITSYVTLKKDGDDPSTMRNINASKVEFKGQQTANIDENLFQNMKLQEDGNAIDFDTIKENTFLDNAIGKAPAD